MDIFVRNMFGFTVYISSSNSFTDFNNICFVILNFENLKKNVNDSYYMFIWKISLKTQ